MEQRAANAHTLAANPEIILMNEPFGALNALTRESIQTHLRQIWERTQRAILFIPMMWNKPCYWQLVLSLCMLIPDASSRFFPTHLPSDRPPLQSLLCAFPLNLFSHARPSLKVSALTGNRNLNQ